MKKTHAFFNAALVLAGVLTSCDREKESPRPAAASINIPDVSNIFQHLQEVNIDKVNNPYNGGLVESPTRKNHYILAFRSDINFATANQNTKIGVVSLDRNWVAREPSILDVRTNNRYSNETALAQAEDPRLFNVGNETYVVFNDSIDGKSTGMREMFVANLVKDPSSKSFACRKIRKLDFVEGRNIHQKNWVPFVTADKKVHFVYQMEPHIILAWDMNSNKITKAAETSSNADQMWQFGKLRGGTPANYVPELDGFLAFFHSFKKIDNIYVYYMGAYVFEKKAPFRIKAITEYPLGFEGQYKESYNGKHVIYPTGFVQDGDSLVVSAGINDMKTVIIKVAIKDLAEKLKPVSPTSLLTKK